MTACRCLTECRVAAQATVRGEQQFRVLGYTANASPTGSPYVAVRVGRILIYVEDRAALDCFAQAWRKAERFADTVFGGPFDSCDGSEDADAG
jgi:hypothetical protein